MGTSSKTIFAAPTGTTPAPLRRVDNQAIEPGRESLDTPDPCCYRRAVSPIRSPTPCPGAEYTAKYESSRCGTGISAGGTLPDRADANQHALSRLRMGTASRAQPLRDVPVGETSAILHGDGRDSEIPVHRSTRPASRGGQETGHPVPCDFPDISTEDPLRPAIPCACECHVPVFASTSLRYWVPESPNIEQTTKITGRST